MFTAKVLRFILKQNKRITMMRGSTIFLHIVALSACAESARIIGLFPFPAKSHHYVFRPIMEELSKRGHEVLYVTGSKYDKVPQGITELFVKVPDLLSAKVRELSWADIGDNSIPVSVINLYEILFRMTGSFLSDPKVQQLIHSNDTYDAVLFESYFAQEYFSTLIHKFGAVGIEVMPHGDNAWANELSGLPNNPSYQMDLRNAHSNTFSFFEKLYNIYVTTTVTAMSYYYLLQQQVVADTYFNYTGWETRPPLHKMVSNRSLILTNSHFATGYPTPAAPHKKEIGGINIREPKPLPKDLQAFMDQSKQGVILMSLGATINVADVANGNLKDVFMNVFRELPYNILLKWETDNPGEFPPNVRISKWFPQQDILGHRNCILFITHGGYLSITEALHFGVPLVGIPFFGDQGKNLAIAQEAGYGRMLRFRNISKETIIWTLKEVISNRRYKDEAMRRSKLFRDRRHSPAEDAVYWIEHAIKYPNALTPKAAWLSFVQLHLIDVYLFFLAAAVCLGYLTCKLLRAIGNLCKSKSKAKTAFKKKLKKN